MRIVEAESILIPTGTQSQGWFEAIVDMDDYVKRGHGAGAVIHIIIIIVCAFQPFHPSHVIREHSDRYFVRVRVRVRVGLVPSMVMNTIM